MSRTMNRVVGSGALVLLILSSLVAMAKAESAAQRQAALRKAVNAALAGPEAKKLEVNGHKFNVKKASVMTVGDMVTVKGQISHHLTLRPDDQMYYTIKKSNGKVTSVEIKIEAGGVSKYVGKLVKHVTNIPFSDSGSEAILRRLGGLIDKGWEDASELIVAAIAVKVNDGGPIVRDQRTPAPRPVSRPRPVGTSVPLKTKVN